MIWLRTESFSTKEVCKFVASVPPAAINDPGRWLSSSSIQCGDIVVYVGHLVSWLWIGQVPDLRSLTLSICAAQNVRESLYLVEEIAAVKRMECEEQPILIEPQTPDDVLTDSRVPRDEIN